jgi:NAD-dependent deacetylase
MPDIQPLIAEAAERIIKARRPIAFTGAGISVESGIPAFRGENGVWSKYDPHCIEIDYFLTNPPASWKLIKEIFYDHFGNSAPNPAHIALAEMENTGIIKGVVTQNIDSLHQKAGSKQVIEYHGSFQRLVCLNCSTITQYAPELISTLPPLCPVCRRPLKPDFVFFGETIPQKAQLKAMAEITQSDLWLVIGTSGEVMPACSLPREAKYRGAYIIEVNISPTQFTSTITDIFLQGKASEVLTSLKNAVLSSRKGFQ